MMCSCWQCCWDIPVTPCNPGVCKGCVFFCGRSSLFPACHCLHLKWPFHCRPAWFDGSALIRSHFFLCCFEQIYFLVCCLMRILGRLSYLDSYMDQKLLCTALGFAISIAVLVCFHCAIDPASFLHATAAAWIWSGGSPAFLPYTTGALLWSLCLHFRCFW